MSSPQPGAKMNLSYKQAVMLRESQSKKLLNLDNIILIEI